MKMWCLGHDRKLLRPECSVAKSTLAFGASAGEYFLHMRFDCDAKSASPLSAKDLYIDTTKEMIWLVKFWHGF